MSIYRAFVPSPSLILLLRLLKAGEDAASLFFLRRMSILNSRQEFLTVLALAFSQSLGLLRDESINHVLKKLLVLLILCICPWNITGSFGRLHFFFVFFMQKLLKLGECINSNFIFDFEPQVVRHLLLYRLYFFCA